MTGRKKVGTALNEKLLADAQAYARRQGMPFNELLEEALDSYLSHARTQRSVVEETKGSYRVSPTDLARVLEEDLYGAD